MTDQEERIMWEILQAEDKSIQEDTIPCTFYGTRITKRTTSSQSVGYKLIEDYTWVEAYNNANILGGYACTDITQSIEEVTS